MLLRPLVLLYGSKPIAFTSDLPIDRAVARLRKATAKSPVHSVTRQAAAGTVTECKVSLQRAIPFVGNSFKPFFIGRFETEGGRTVLRGAFTMHWLVKIFMSIWFGFCILWALLALRVAIAGPTQAWFVPLAGLLMLLAGAAFVRLCQWFSRNDEQYLSKVITDALALSPDHWNG